MRVLFWRVGASRPIVTPDLPGTEAIEAWAQRTYGYATDELWGDIPVEDWDDAPPLAGTGDTELDWPVRRTLCDEDWYCGPIEVLE